MELTIDNVETVLDEMRPYLISDGGNVELVELDGPIVKLRLQGACGSERIRLGEAQAGCFEEKRGKPPAIP